MESSPYKKIGTNTYSIPTDSPYKLSAFSNKPFELISQQPYYQPFSKLHFNNFHHEGSNDKFYQ